MGTRVKIVLPPGPPAAYRKWVAFWREVEEKMLARPALEALASEASAPFLRGAAAAFWSEVVVYEIMTQALTAKRVGDRLVSPSFAGDAALIAEAVDIVERRGRWLHLDVVAKAIGVEPLERELLLLQAKVIEVIRHQLAGEGVYGQRWPHLVETGDVVYDLRCPCCGADLQEPPRFLTRRKKDLYCVRCAWLMPARAINRPAASLISLPECPTHPEGVFDALEERWESGRWPST